jgi:hypothetical protein
LGDERPGILTPKMRRMDAWKVSPFCGSGIAFQLKKNDFPVPYKLVARFVASTVSQQKKAPSKNAESLYL